MQQSVKPKCVGEIHRMVDPMCCPLLGNTFSSNTITTTANNNNNKLINTPTKEKRCLAFKLLQRVALHKIYILIAIYVLLPYQIHGYNSRKSCVYLSYLLQILSKGVAFYFNKV